MKISRLLALAALTFASAAASASSLDAQFDNSTAALGVEQNLMTFSNAASGSYTLDLTAGTYTLNAFDFVGIMGGSVSDMTYEASGNANSGVIDFGTAGYGTGTPGNPRNTASFTVSGPERLTFSYTGTPGVVGLFQIMYDSVYNAPSTGGGGTIPAVPEPGMGVMFLAGLGGLAYMTKRRQAK